MRLLFHHGKKTKLVRDGDSFTDTCPDCGRRARFEEVEVIESYGVFFVDVVDDRERAYRCRECGELFDLRDQPQPTAKPASRPPPPPAPAPDPRAQQRERAAKASRIEDELAELKKRLGK